MKKYIIRELSAENSDFTSYFDGDTFTERAGNYNYNLFIVCNDRHVVNGYNMEEYKRIKEEVENIINGFYDVQEGLKDYNGKKYTYKNIITDNGLKYSPTLCAKLKKWHETAKYDNTETIAAYLTIKTGHYWKVTSASGYCQGDYCEVIHSDLYVGNIAKQCGEIYLGAAKEFCVIDLDDNGNEIDECYGYIIADSQAWKDEQYKKLVCGWACINPDETELQMIDGYSTQTTYNYRTA